MVWVYKNRLFEDGWLRLFLYCGVYNGFVIVVKIFILNGYLFVIIVDCLIFCCGGLYLSWRLYY